MLWFDPLPWGRWALVAMVAALALYLEFRPDPTVEVPFAVADILPGEVVDEASTEFRPVPVGLLDGAEAGDVTSTRVLAGEPVLASDVDTDSAVVPNGWWIVGVTLPDGAAVGDDVRLVLLATGEEVEGIIAHPGSDDPFAAADGGVAVPTDNAAAVALAAADGRLAVLVSTG
ncbi:MAG TPA: hypothetical protein VFS66_04630 [Acidimicrobiia bacterium]|nr:hypothetical protein [Acidimicrobiia bacterium]